MNKKKTKKIYDKTARDYDVSSIKCFLDEAKKGRFVKTTENFDKQINKYDNLILKYENLVSEVVDKAKVMNFDTAPESKWIFLMIK